MSLMTSKADNLNAATFNRYFPALDYPSTVEDSDKDGSTDTHTDKETNKISRESSPAPALRVRPGMH